MAPEIRRFFLLLAASAVAMAVVWASFFDSLPPAEFSLQSGADPKTLDPARATGNIEGRLLYELFEGLLQMLPDGPPDSQTGVQAMSPQPAIAESFELAQDGRRYTFHLRKDAKWTDGSPVTSHDFAWSWQRFLHPETACEYTFHLFSIPYARAYAEATVNVGDRVEVELWNRPNETAGSEPNFQAFPRGTILYGTLKEIRKPAEPKGDQNDKAGKDSPSQKELADWQEQWVYVVDVVQPAPEGNVDWNGPSKTLTFARDVNSPVADQSTQAIHQVLVAFDKLGGLETPDDHTFVVNLTAPVPYFTNIVAFYPLFPVNRHCVETHGAPQWTKPENIVTNGPYRLELRRLRDRLRLVKNEGYYAADQVSIHSADFMSMEGENTALNMYETGQLHWVTQPPTLLLEDLKGRPDFSTGPKLSIYFYRLNVKRPPLDNVLVRRAIAMAINRQEIVDEVTKGGQLPAFSLVPPGLAGYQSASGLKFDVDEAKRLLSEAGYPGGRGIPNMTILYNTMESHQAIAEVIQQQLQNHLNISVQLQNMEWGTYLDKIKQADYQIARHGWIADYPDPNTFLDLWVTDGPQNNTNWSNQEFDRLIKQSAMESDPKKRLTMLHDAEQIWLDEMPVIPIYFYTSTNMIKQNISGFAPTAQDIHPLKLLRITPP